MYPQQQHHSKQMYARVGALNIAPQVSNNRLHNCVYSTAVLRHTEKCSYEGIVTIQNVKKGESPRVQILFECSICHQQTDSKTVAEIHFKANHSPLEIFTCGHCGYTTHTLDSMVLHVHSRHPEPKCHRCINFTAEFNAQNRLIAAQYSKGERINYLNPQAAVQLDPRGDMRSKKSSIELSFTDDPHPVTKCYPASSNPILREQRKVLQLDGQTQTEESEPLLKQEMNEFLASDAYRQLTWIHKRHVVCKMIAHALRPIQKALAELYTCPLDKIVPQSLQFGDHESGIFVHDIPLAATSGLAGIQKGTTHCIDITLL